jgi:hypothetical protein
MPLTEPVKRILANHESDNPGTRANLARIPMQGELGLTGRLLIRPAEGLIGSEAVSVLLNSSSSFPQKREPGIQPLWVPAFAGTTGEWGRGWR